jgi:hypothetical protein
MFACVRVQAADDGNEAIGIVRRLGHCDMQLGDVGAKYRVRLPVGESRQSVLLEQSLVKCDRGRPTLGNDVICKEVRSNLAESLGLLQLRDLQGRIVPDGDLAHG